MKKAIWVILFAILLVGISKGQMAIAGGIFAENPTRFNGRMITLKNIQLNMNVQNPVSGAVQPASPHSVNVNSGNNSSTTVITPQRCNPPRGFKKLDVEFLEKPEFESCFFIAESMYCQLKKETAGKNKIDIQLTFRGDNRTGYNITSYRLGK